MGGIEVIVWRKDFNSGVAVNLANARRPRITARAFFDLPLIKSLNSDSALV
jgi:hypothetical protein